MVPSICSSHDRAKVTYSGPVIRIRKGNTMEIIVRAACLASPCISAICGSDNRAFSN